MNVLWHRQKMIVKKDYTGVIEDMQTLPTAVNSHPKYWYDMRYAHLNPQVRRSSTRSRFDPSYLKT